MDVLNLIKRAEEKLNEYNCNLLKKIGILPMNDMHHVPTITYPSYLKNSPGNESQILKNLTDIHFYPFALYFHIPFCKAMCSFCQYETCSYKSKEDIDKYLDYIEKEINLWKIKFPKANFKPTSVFIGGGTPSLLDTYQLERFLKIIKLNFDLSSTPQFSVDIEPSTVCGKEGLKKLNVMKENGINRVCLGAQFLNNEILKKMKRPHNSEHIEEASKLIKEIKFESFLVDLIFGFPESDLNMWVDTLLKTINLNVDGYQLYQLRVLSFRSRQTKKVALKEEYIESPETFLPLKDVYLMKMIGALISEENGFKQYGRGVFLKHPKHNSKYLESFYCNASNVLGLGKGSVSSINRTSFMHAGKNLEDYYKPIDKGILPMNFFYRITNTKEYLRACIILPLKNCGIVYKRKYKQFTGRNISDDFMLTVEKLKNFGFLQEDENSISFTEKGLFFDDDILLHFYNINEIPLPRSAYSNGEMNPFTKTSGE